MKICLFPICAFLCAASALAQTQLNNTPVPGGGVKYGGGEDAAATADSSRVVYRGDLTTDNVFELYSASTTASGTQITLNNMPTPGGDVYNFAPTANGSRAVYRGDLTTDNVYEIYSALTTAAGTQITLNNTPAPGGNISYYYHLTADSSRVVYSGGLTTVNVIELYSASTTAAGTQVKLNNTPVTNGDVWTDSIFLTPDSSKALYLGDLTTDEVVELYSASTTAADTQIKVNNSPVPGGSVTGGSGMNATPTADSSRVVYAGDLTTVGVDELYSASTTAAGTQIKLNDTPVAGGYVRGFAVTANGSKAVYTGNLETTTVTEIYSASTTATGTQIKLNNTPVPGGTVSSFAITADGSRAVYQGDLTMDGVEELYSASTSTAGTQIKLTNALVSGGLDQFALAADSSRVVYSGILTTPGVYGLYSASTTSEGTQVLLSTGGNYIDNFKIAPNSEFVVYREINVVTYWYSLWYVDILGASAPTQLTPSTAYNPTINSYSILPDSSGVVFNTDLTTQGVYNLYSAAVVPEPSTWALAGIGLAVSLWRLRRRK